MAYATTEGLLAAMHVTAPKAVADSTALAQACLDAAAEEIDHAVDAVAGSELSTLDPLPALVVQVNIARGVEWFKAQDAVFGGVGFAQLGVLRVPTDGFERYAAALIPQVQQFGLA